MGIHAVQTAALQLILVCFLAISCSPPQFTSQVEAGLEEEDDEEFQLAPYGLETREDAVNLSIPGSYPDGSAIDPQNLSETNLFDDLNALIPAQGLIEFEPNSKLWSNGAGKRRFAIIPGTSQITFNPTGPWSFPIGTILVKHFEYTLIDTSIKRLETRLLTKVDVDGAANGGWEAFTYRWNVAGTDATLLDPNDGNPPDEIVDNVDGAAFNQPGVPIQATWTYPVTSCFTCHTTQSGIVQGVRAGQFNGAFDYVSTIDNQIRAWNNIGLFTQDIESIYIGSYDFQEHTYGAIQEYKDFTDTSIPLEDRARSYLATNCSMCHTEGHACGDQGGAATSFYLRYEIPTGAINFAVNGRVLFGQDPALSGVFQRMGGVSGVPNMPPVGTQMVNPFAVGDPNVAGVDGILGEWIGP